MRLPDLKAAKDARPFRPFHLRMADGQEIPVYHPNAMAWEEDTSRVVFVLSQGRHYWLDVALVTALVQPVPAGPPRAAWGGGQP